MARYCYINCILFTSKTDWYVWKVLEQTLDSVCVLSRFVYQTPLVFEYNCVYNMSRLTTLSALRRL